VSNFVALLPCPFCGGSPEICFQRDDIGDYKVECSGCGAVSCPDGMRYDRQLAIDDWNKRRLPEAFAPELLKALVFMRRTMYSDTSEESIMADAVIKKATGQ
jgi:Lar family restriction alleviation protein